MSRFHLPLLSILLILHHASSLKIFTLVQPYLIQSPSTTLVNKQEPEELPIYRDLPPIKKETKDLSDALEATRNLKFSRPPLDTDAFFASLKKAAEEVRSVVIGVAPSFPNVQIRKSDVMDVIEKHSGTKEEEPIAKTSTEPFKAHPKANTANSQVKRSDSSFVAYLGPEEESSLQKEASSSIDVKVQAPFTDVEVRKAAVEDGVADERVPVTDQPGSELPPPPPPLPHSGFGVHVEAPFTNVRVQKADGLGYGGHGGYGSQVGVRVQAPFTNVKVKKLAADYPADYPPGAAPPSYPAGEVPPSYPSGAAPPSYPGGAADVGVRVEAPFVKVKVDGTATHPRPLIGDDGVLSTRSKKHGRPLNLDINIPGIFNLKLLRDSTGRGRLGIGVLPIFSDLMNSHKPSDSYPGPPPS